MGSTVDRGDATVFSLVLWGGGGGGWLLVLSDDVLPLMWRWHSFVMETRGFEIRTL
jgi:hypothetical protein